MTSKERVQAAIARQPVDRVPMGFYAVDCDTIQRVIGRPTLVRNKVETQIALWEGRRDELVESIKKDTVEFYRKIDCADIILPKEGLGWEIEATAVIKGTPHEEAAKKLADFSASAEAMDLYKENFAVLAQPGIAKPQTELPADYEQRLIKNDFAWASKNRDEILAEWRKRYDGKSEKVAAK